MPWQVSNPQVDGLSAVILAGGASRRMGRDKASLVHEGEPLLHRQLRLLTHTGIPSHRQWVSLRPDSPSPPVLPAGVRLVRDAPDVSGPLAGLLATLRTVPDGRLLVLPVDVPGLMDVWLKRYLMAATDSLGIVPEGPAGVEPLVAVYPVAQARSAAERLAAARDWAVHRLVRCGEAEGWMQRVPVADADLPALANWNTPEDLPEPGRLGVT